MAFGSWVLRFQALVRYLPEMTLIYLNVCYCVRLYAIKLGSWAPAFSNAFSPVFSLNCFFITASIVLVRSRDRARLKFVCWKFSLISYNVQLSGIYNRAYDTFLLAIPLIFRKFPRPFTVKIFNTVSWKVVVDIYLFQKVLNNWFKVRARQ